VNFVEQETQGRVRLVFLNRPDKRNALSAELADAVEAALRAADRDPSVGAIVLAARGPAFCAGGDLAEFHQLSQRDPAALYDQGRAGVGLFGLPAVLGTPVVAAVHGHVLGGGMGLLLVAHLAVAGASTRFGLPEMERGLFPYTVFPLLVRAVGERRALALALSARSLGADEALAWGLVDDVVPEPQVLGHALALAQRLAAVSPIVVRTGLEAARASMGSMDTRMDHLVLLRNLALSSPDLRERASRFLAGHEPKGSPS
jgi:methylglutaconyl-CoA hydratase